MPDTFELCITCKSEYPTGELHKCYDIINSDYIHEFVLDEFFVQCGLCFNKATLSSLLSNGSTEWRRMKKATQWKGYVCGDCAKKLNIT